MNANAKKTMLELRLKNLAANDKDNYGVQRKLRRQIQSLKNEGTQDENKSVNLEQTEQEIKT